MVGMDLDLERMNATLALMLSALLRQHNVEAGEDPHAPVVLLADHFNAVVQEVKAEYDRSGYDAAIMVYPEPYGDEGVLLVWKVEGGKDAPNDTPDASA